MWNQPRQYIDGQLEEPKRNLAHSESKLNSCQEFFDELTWARKLILVSQLPSTKVNESDERGFITSAEKVISIVVG